MVSTVNMNYTNLSDFYDNYYKNMSDSGYVNNIKFFDTNCICTYNNQYIKSINDLFIKLSQHNIYRFLYTSVVSSSQIQQNVFIIQTSGMCKIVNLQNIIIGEQHFSETFLISGHNNKIINYICHYY